MIRGKILPPPHITSSWEDSSRADSELNGNAVGCRACLRFTQHVRQACRLGPTGSAGSADRLFNRASSRGRRPALSMIARGETARPAVPPSNHQPQDDHSASTLAA